MKLSLIGCAIAFVFCVAFAKSVHADPLAGMVGVWTGSGWARQVPGAAKEALRCRLSNTYDAAKRRLDINGQCAVPGKRLEIGGPLVVARQGA